MARLAGVVQWLVEAGEGLAVPDEVVVVVVIRSVDHRVITVPQYTLQLTRHPAVVPVPQTVCSEAGGGGGAQPRPADQISPVLTLPPRIASYNITSQS